MEGHRCPASVDCEKKCPTLHAHIATLSREDQQKFLLSLTRKQRGELATTISGLPRRDRPRVMGASDARTPQMARTEANWGDIARRSAPWERSSNRRKAPLYTISKTTRYAPFSLSRKAGDEVDQWTSSLRIADTERAIERAVSCPSLLGPGSYALECDFPGQFDLPAGLNTRTSRAPSYGFDRALRTDSRGTLKGISVPVTHELAAGSYKKVSVGYFKSPVAPQFTIPKNPTGRERAELMSRSGQEL